MSGKPHHKVTDETKAQVIALKSCGHTQEEIGTYLGISIDTLTRHYKYELEIARIQANSEMARRLYKKGLEGDVTCMIFWLKTQARWRTEDSKQSQESNEEVIREMKAVRAKLDAQFQKDY